MTDSKIWDKVWNDPGNQEEWNYLSQVILDELEALLRREGLSNQGGLKMAEVGCGSGRISTRLARGFPCSLSVLVDHSPVAVTRLKAAVEAGVGTGEVVRGDLFAIPVKDNSLDLVWNAGVLEHFTGHTQDRAVSEMLRVLKPGGFFISLNPFAGSILHTLGKAFVESVTTYPYGEEIPIKSLQKSAGAAGQRLHGKEFSTGFIVLFVGMFKRLMIVPGLSFFKIFYTASDRFFCSLYKYGMLPKYMRAADLALARLFGGYLLATIIKKQ